MPFLKIFNLFFRKRAREGQGEKHRCGLLPGTWPATQACALAGIQPADPSVHGRVPNAEPHQPGLNLNAFRWLVLRSSLLKLLCAYRSFKDLVKMLIPFP